MSIQYFCSSDHVWLMRRSTTQEHVPYLLREVRLRILASVTTGNCRSGVRDLWGEGLRAAVREKGWVGSSKELLLAPASSLAGSESAGLARDAEGAEDVIQSGLIWCWCAWVCWNCCVRVCCVCCVCEGACAGRTELRSWCFGGVWSPSSCSRPPSLCSGILNWRSYVCGWQKREPKSGYYIQTAITRQLYIAAGADEWYDNDNVIRKVWWLCFLSSQRSHTCSTASSSEQFLFLSADIRSVIIVLWYGILVFSRQDWGF